MAADERWYFTKEQLGNTPTRKCGLDADKELSNRQQAANFMQDLGQRIRVNQLCINTAIVYMHRFYMFHSFTKFHRNAVSVCALFLAAKVEEQPRKLEFILKWAHTCLHPDAPALDQTTESFMEQAQELVINENIMLQTLGFDVAIDHPHTHVVKCCQLVRASKDLAQTSYFMATNSLHLTTMSVQYKPTVVACVCIHLACKWASWEIPKSSEGKAWFWYVDRTVTDELLEELTTDFLAILDRCPNRLKKKMMSCGGSNDKLPDEIMNLDKRFSGNSNSPSFPVNPQAEHPFDRERSSSMSSSSSGRAPAKVPLFDNGPSPAPLNPDKNGTAAAAAAADANAKARAAAKKEQHLAAQANATSSASRSTAASSGSHRHSSAPQIASPLVTSPRRGQQATLATNTSASALSTSSTAVSQSDLSHNSSTNQQGESPALTRRSKQDTNRPMTHMEYRERKKRELVERDSERVPPVPASPIVPSTVATKQPTTQQQQPSSHGNRLEQQQRQEQRERETAAARGLALANNSSSAKQNQPSTANVSGARPSSSSSSHHHHHLQHNRKTPEKQRHHQESERGHRPGGGGINVPGGPVQQRGPAQPPPTLQLLPHGVDEKGEGNHVGGRPTSRAAPSRPVPPTGSSSSSSAPARQAPPPLLTPSPPMHEDDHDGVAASQARGGGITGSRPDTLVNPLDGRAMVIPSIDTRTPSSRSNHSVAGPVKDAGVEQHQHRRRDEPQAPQRDERMVVLPSTQAVKRHMPTGKECKDRLIKHHKSKAWPPPPVVAEPSPTPPPPLLNPLHQHHHHHQHHHPPPPSSTAGAPPAMPNQVLPPSPSIKVEPAVSVDAKPSVATPVSSHHAVKTESVVTRFVASAGTGQQPPSTPDPAHRTHHQPLPTPEDRLHSRSKLLRGELGTGDVSKRGSSTVIPPHLIKGEPSLLESNRRSAPAATQDSSTKDDIGLPSQVVDVKVKLEPNVTVTAHSQQHNRHPEPTPPNLAEPKQSVVPSHLLVKVEPVAAAPVVVANVVNVEPAGTVMVPPIAAVKEQAMPVVAAAPVASALARESRTKASAAQVKEVKPMGVQHSNKEVAEALATVVVAPASAAPPLPKGRPNLSQPTPDISKTPDNLRPRTSARREVKESKAKLTGPPAVVIESPVSKLSVAPSAEKISSPIKTSSAQQQQLTPAAATVDKSEPIVSVLEKPVKVDPPTIITPMLQTLNPPSVTSASTPTTPVSSSKHERREKHRHKDKDRDKDRSSKERKKEEAAANKALLLQQQQQASANSTPPAIKLTIAKDRLQMANSVDSGATAGGSRLPCSPKDSIGLKIKIPKDKFGSSSSNSRSSTSKSHNSNQSGVGSSDGAGVGSGGGSSSSSSSSSVPSLGLKIKITKDRMGSTVMSSTVMESNKDRPPTTEPHRENRKREREPSPKVAAADKNDDRSSVAKAPKLTRATARRNSESGNAASSAVARPAGSATTPADVPPSSNTRSSRGQPEQQHSLGPRHPVGVRGGRPEQQGRGRLPHHKQQQHGGYMGHSMAPSYGGPTSFYNPMYQQFPPPPPQFQQFHQPPPNYWIPPHGIPPHGIHGIPPHGVPPNLVPMQHSGHRYPGHSQGAALPPLPREPPPSIPPPPPE